MREALRVHRMIVSVAASKMDHLRPRSASPCPSWWITSTAAPSPAPGGGHSRARRRRYPPRCSGSRSCCDPGYQSRSGRRRGPRGGPGSAAKRPAILSGSIDRDVLREEDELSVLTPWNARQPGLPWAGRRTALRRRRRAHALAGRGARASRGRGRRARQRRSRETFSSGPCWPKISANPLPGSTPSINHSIVGSSPISRSSYRLEPGQSRLARQADRY